MPLLVPEFFRCAAAVALCFLPAASAQNAALPEAQALGGAQCGSDGRAVYDTIIVGAGLSGLSAAKELQHLGHRVLILERNADIGGRASVGWIGDEKVPIDYGGAWLHGVPTNPLTGLVDALGFGRVRTELDAPYYVYNTPTEAGKPDQATRAEPADEALFEEAIEVYEEAAGVAASAQEYEHGLAKYACSAAVRIRHGEMTPREFCDQINGMTARSRDGRALCAIAGREKQRLSPEAFCETAKKRFLTTSDVAENYVPRGRFERLRRLVVANAGPLESAAELDRTSAVDAARFEAGEDDLTDQGMGAFVKKFGGGLPVCTNSPVTEIRYGRSEAGVTVVARGQEYQGKSVLVTVSTGVLRAGKIRFAPPLPKWKTDAIQALPMGNLQKIIIPFRSDVFGDERPNSWVLYDGQLSPVEQKLIEPLPRPVQDQKRLAMAFVIKPLGKSMAIGFFGGDWAKALEGQCEGRKHGSGPRDPCDEVAIALTKTALTKMYGQGKVMESIVEDQIHVTRWSLDETSLGAYSVASPGNWDQHEALGKPVGLDEESRPRVFFAGEGTARAIYNGSYPGAYESGIQAARAIHVEMLHLRN